MIQRRSLISFLAAFTSLTAFGAEYECYARFNPASRTSHNAEKFRVTVDATAVSNFDPMASALHTTGQKDLNLLTAIDQKSIDVGCELK